MVVVTIGIGSRPGDDQPERSCCALSLVILVYSFAHLVPLFSFFSVRALLLFSVCHHSRPHPLLYSFRFSCRSLFIYSALPN